MARRSSHEGFCASRPACLLCSYVTMCAPSSPSCPSPLSLSLQSLATFLARLGLERCEPVQELGRGGFGRVQAVNITLPGGGVIKAVRKEIFRRTDGLSRTELLQQEVAGTRAAAGCASAVQLLGYTEPQTDDDPHELLLSYVPGMTLSAYLVSGHCLGGALLSTCMFGSCQRHARAGEHRSFAQFCRAPLPYALRFVPY